MSPISKLSVVQENFPVSFIHLFIHYLLSTYYVLGISEPESRQGLTLMWGRGVRGAMQGKVQVTCTYGTKKSRGKNRGMGGVPC